MYLIKKVNADKFQNIDLMSRYIHFVLKYFEKQCGVKANSILAGTMDDDFISNKITLVFENLEESRIKSENLISKFT